VYCPAKISRDNSEVNYLGYTISKSPDWYSYSGFTGGNISSGSIDGKEK
jgi:hypothetical protein